jgi:hypothetical protein
MTTGFAPHAPAFASMEQADEQFSFAPQIDLQDHKDSEGVLSNGRWSLDDKFDALGNMIVAHAAGESCNPSGINCYETPEMKWNGT